MSPAMKTKGLEHAGEGHEADLEAPPDDLGDEEDAGGQREPGRGGIPRLVLPEEIDGLHGHPDEQQRERDGGYHANIPFKRRR